MSLRASFICAFLMVSEYALAECPNLWVNVDILYWKPWERSLVLTNKKSPVFFTDDFTEARVIHPHFKWDVGARLGLGYRFSSSLWDVAASWLHYHTTVDQRRNEQGLEGMFPIWSLSNDTLAGDYVTEAELNWKLALDLLDLEFGRSFTFNCFEIRPFLGLRSGWIHQKMDIEYEGGIFLNAILQGGVSLDGEDRIKMKNNFWGIGPRIGIDPSLSLGKGFSFYADAALSGLLGYFSLRQKEIYLERTRFHYRNHPVAFRYIADLAIGASWKQPLYQDKYALSFKLGWEYHLFFHQMRLKKDEFHLISHRSNLDVQGVTFSSCFNF